MEVKKTIISLTSWNSHTMIIPPGQGSLSIGTKGISDGKYDFGWNRTKLGCFQWTVYWIWAGT